ncbi:hypothetical protein KOR42_28470 [Thalassoglobus neptunius]|uniref:Uncharacterized protein n=1 Tax=Thalassoglobus neptunius TaxID=1938619 RepID=A0A5C5WZE0_9PLAN|nr:hypothetical protein KOR42_28470 [Thalassoglobus neptunius]
MISIAYLPVYRQSVLSLWMSERSVGCGIGHRLILQGGENQRLESIRTN